MKAEIISIGTELLLGQIVNTNAKYISEVCAGIGVDVYFQTVVGDNANRIQHALDHARSRADVIICTGGLGPTQDDLTKDVLAAYLGRKLTVHQPTLDKMTAMFKARGTDMLASNARMANMIEGAHPLWNDTGQAVGLALTAEGTHYILIPGPPREMKPMMDRYVVPWLQTLFVDELPLFSTILKFAGIGESNLEHSLLDLIDNQQDPSIAPYASEGEVMVRLTTRAESRTVADQRMQETIEAIRERVGAHLYAIQDISLEEAIIQRMKEAGLTFCAAESCSGGLLGHLATAIPGGSSVFKGSVVCYSNEMKERVLQIPREVLEGDNAPGPISEETAIRMADQVRQLMDTDYSISITGVAGPGDWNDHPPGLVYVGIAQRGRPTYCLKLQLSGGRETVKLRAVKSAFYEIWKLLLDNDA